MPAATSINAAMRPDGSRTVSLSEGRSRPVRPCPSAGPARSDTQRSRSLTRGIIAPLRGGTAPDALLAKPVVLEGDPRLGPYPRLQILDTASTFRTNRASCGRTGSTAARRSPRRCFALAVFDSLRPRGSGIRTGTSRWGRRAAADPAAVGTRNTRPPSSRAKAPPILRSSLSHRNVDLDGAGNGSSGCRHADAEGVQVALAGDGPGVITYSPGPSAQKTRARSISRGDRS